MVIATLQKKSQSSPHPRAPRRVDLANFTLKDIPDIPTDTVIECLKDEEYGDAALFAELFTGRCIFDHTDKAWYTYQGHYWKVDDTEIVKHLVSGALASTYMKASAGVNLWLDKIEDTPENKDKIKYLKELIKSLLARAHSLKMASRMRNVLSYAASFLAITSDKWDTLKWVLGTESGVIDLRTGTLRAGKPEDYIRTIIPTFWRGLEAECPRFERFLQEIFSDRTEQERDELISFLHRALGYGIAGLASIHMFLMLYGDEGRNGKTLLMTVIKKVLGSAVGAVSNDVLIDGSKFSTPGAAKPHLVSLQGKRLAWASETSKGERFAIGQVKFLTGGDEIPARQLYGKEYTFDPSHLLILLTNNKPHADAKDKAFWERICPVTFNVRFVESPDPTKSYERKADDKLVSALEVEASGILAWLVRGCLQWQRVGMNTPASVLKARARYREEEDTLGLFIHDICVQNARCSVKPQVLYAQYCDWSEANNLKPMSGTAFGVEMSKAYKKVHTREGNFYQGIGLQSVYPELVDMQDESEPEPEPSASTNGHRAVQEPALVQTTITEQGTGTKRVHVQI